MIGYSSLGDHEMTSELRIPADPAYIVVAKRTAAAVGSVHGLGIEALDDLTIAVAQACEILIARMRRAVGPGGLIRLAFAVEQGRLEVQIRGQKGRAATRPAPVQVEAEDLVEAEARARQEARRAAVVGRLAREAEVAARHEAMRAEAAEQAAREEAAVATELALRVMGLFVDECRYKLDQRTGGLHVRLTKFCSS